VVVSAGNEGGPVGAPANCPGAMAIAGIRHAGTKVGFSSLGTQVALSAPGGNCVNTTGLCLFSLDTTSNSGTTTPSTSNFTDMTNTNLGTSFSAPIVSGVAALMLSVNGNLKSSQLIARMKEGATPFPVSNDTSIPTCQVPSNTTGLQTSECKCTTSTCGAGMANAARSVQAALRPIAAVALAPQTLFNPGTAVTLNATGSTAACNRTVTSYSWTAVSGTNTGGIANANTPNPTIITPAAGTTYTIRLTVTDDVGMQDTADVLVSSSSYTSTAPGTGGTSACLKNVSYTAPATAADTAASASTPPPGTNNGSTANSNRGGGGGALGWLALWMLALPLTFRLFYRPAMRSAESSQDF